MEAVIAELRRQRLAKAAGLLEANYARIGEAWDDDALIIRDLDICRGIPISALTTNQTQSMYVVVRHIHEFAIADYDN